MRFWDKFLFGCAVTGVSQNNNKVSVMRLPDYIAIGVLIVLVAWAAADLIPRDKFKL
jgi:hypothetical protein